MKQGLNFLMEVQVGIDLDLVEKIEFILKQGDKKKEFVYPSDNAVKRTDKTVDIRWTREDSWYFDPDREVFMDTRITLKDSIYNPETKIVSLKINRTLFGKDE